MELFSLIESDFNRYIYVYRRDKLSFGKILYRIIFEYGFYATIVYRIGNSIENKMKQSIFYYPLIALYYVMNFAVITLYGIKIDKCATIGKGLFIGHFGGIKIEKCTMGDLCSVYHQVHIGKTEEKHNQAAFPIIGNSVWIGAHSTVYATVRLEDNVTIIVGSCVKSLLPKNCLAMGNPARVVNKNFDQSTLLAVPGNP